MDLLKSHFIGFDIWRTIEPKLAMLCADLDEPTTEPKKLKVITGLNRIKKYLMDCEVNPENLRFLDDETDRYRYTRQISLYVEKDDYIERDIIDKYSRLSYGSEGVMGIHLPYSYEQVKKLTNGVYNETGLIKFYISNEISLQGKITAEIYEHSQKIPIAKLIESHKLNKDTGEPLVKKIILFGERYAKNSYTLIKEIEVPFYVYRFISHSNDEYIILTTDECTIGDYVVTGMVTQCDDYKAITDSAKLPTKLPYIFVQYVKNRIIQFKSNNELMDRAKYLSMTRDNIWNIPFTILKNKVQYILKQPDWYKWLVWAWLTHQPKGLMNTYPLHIMVIGPPGSGKSIMLNALHSRSNEPRPIFSGVGSTLKALVPSFKYRPAKMGYLAECNRYSFCDEFLRCLVNANKSDSTVEEGVGKMNDLLEHQKRSASSGVSNINVVNMTSRIFAMTNPIRSMTTVNNLLNTLDKSFMSRWLVYYQNPSHVKLIKDSQDDSLDTHGYKISNNNLISVLDYMNVVPAKYDLDRVTKIYESVKVALNETLVTHYSTRHKHHIECLIDGIIKARCLFDNNPEFVAKDEDYAMLEVVWKAVICSWIDAKDIGLLPVDERLQFLPMICQDLYWALVSEDRALNRTEVYALGTKVLSKVNVTNALVLLIEHGILTEDGNTITVYRWKR